VSKQIAQQRRDLLAGKKGIERMMEARVHSAGTLTIDDESIDMQSAFIDATFRHWGWKTITQFAKWAEAERNIIAEMKAEYDADLKNRQKHNDLVETKKHYNEEMKSYKETVKGLKLEWFLTCDGAVNAMRHSDKTGSFTCHVRYISKRLDNRVTNLNLIVDEAWVLDHYGAEIADYIKEASRKPFDGFLPVVVTGKTLTDVNDSHPNVDSIRFVETM
jgi:hypothetical protein